MLQKLYEHCTVKFYSLGKHRKFKCSEHEELSCFFVFFKFQKRVLAGVFSQIFLVVLRCQGNQWQQQGQTTAKALRNQSSTLPFSKARIRPRSCPPPLLHPHRSTLQPTTSLQVVPMMYTGRRSSVCTHSPACVYMYTRSCTWRQHLIKSVLWISDS